MDQTNPEVTDTENTEVAEKPAELSPRDQRMAELARERFDEESGTKSEDAVAGPVDAAPEKRKFKIKVYGQEQEIDEDEVLRRVQTDIAAGQKLAQAKQAYATVRQQAEDIERQRREMMEMQARLHATNKAAEIPADATPDEIKAALDELDQSMDSLYEGDSDAAKKRMRSAFEKALKANKPVGLNGDEIAHRAAQFATQHLQNQQLQQAQQRVVQNIQQATESFKQEFPDIASDPRLFAYADKETEILMQESPNLSPLEIMRAAGQRIRQMNGKPTVRTQKTSRPSPVTGSRRAGLGEPEHPPPTTDDVIADMKRARGQPV